MSKRRAVITGLGVIAPAGVGKENYWQGLLSAKSFITRMTPESCNLPQYDISQLKSQIWGQVKDFDPRVAGLREDQIRRMDRYVQFAVAGTLEAVADAGLDFSPLNRDRCGVALANAICGTKMMEEEFVVVTQWGQEPINPEYVSPYLYNASMFNNPSNEISALYNLRAVCTTISTGCTAGTDAMGYALECIQNDEADLIICGAAEAPLTPISMVAFDVINAIATRNHEPHRASRPFDKDREGFVLSEGCGIFILEELEHAQKRGAKIYAEILGFGSTMNAYHMTDLEEDGRDQARAMKIALDDSGIDPREVDYISAHGSSTPQNDVSETGAIKDVFGDHAYKIPVSSLKGAMGHPLAAANAVELIACCLSLERDMILPTLNLDNPDPRCDLDYVPHKPRAGRKNVILKNSSGFSGIHSAVVLRRFEG
jgi:beta-ketoacyl-acyl-carrier-protein synthase II